MKGEEEKMEKLSPWWRRAVILTLALGFTVLIWLSTKSYQDAPPIPGKVVSAAGDILFTREDILAGQQVFLKYGLMETAPFGATVLTSGPISLPNTCTRSPLKQARYLRSRPIIAASRNSRATSSWS